MGSIPITSTVPIHESHATVQERTDPCYSNITKNGAVVELGNLPPSRYTGSSPVGSTLHRLEGCEGLSSTTMKSLAKSSANVNTSRENQRRNMHKIPETVIQQAIEERTALEQRLAGLNFFIEECRRVNSGKAEGTREISDHKPHGQGPMIAGEETRGRKPKGESLRTAEFCTSWIREHGATGTKDLLSLLGNHGLEIRTQRPDASLRSLLLRSGGFAFDAATGGWILTGNNSGTSKQTVDAE